MPRTHYPEPVAIASRDCSPLGPFEGPLSRSMPHSGSPLRLPRSTRAVSPFIQLTLQNANSLASLKILGLVPALVQREELLVSLQSRRDLPQLVQNNRTQKPRAGRVLA